MIGLFDVVLVALVLALAAWTLVARENDTAVVGFVGFGLVVSLVWVRLHAVDAALTEAAIGGGVTGALFLAAASRLPGTETASDWPSPALRRAAGLLCAAISAGLTSLVLFPPPSPPSLAAPALAGLPTLGLGHAVTGVLIAYRAIDTLLEKIVLLLAVVGVWSLTPDSAWGGLPDLRPRGRPDGALRLLGQLLPPFGVVVAVYMLWVSADHPGGAFQSGTILAAMAIMVVWAGLRPMPAIARKRLRWLLIGGPALFMAVGFAGLAWAGAFLAYPAPFAKAVIVVVEVPLTISIGITLTLLAAGPATQELS